MKYTSEQVCQMSWAEWNDIMAKELNEAGFRARGFNPDSGKWENNRELYNADSLEPKFFILGTVDGASEFDHLKKVGLLNNGRCPMCGEPILGNPGRFTSGYDCNAHFQICQNCANIGRRTSLNPANNKGCFIALLLLPYYLLKGLFY
jgi:hypothetical protein